MVKVEIADSLVEEADKRFKKESIRVFRFMKTLEANPKKGKLLAAVGGIAVKELKYRSFRFYFLADDYKLKFTDEESIVDLLLRFVRMSSRKYQHKVIDEIKEVLIKIGPEGFK